MYIYIYIYIDDYRCNYILYICKNHLLQVLLLIWTLFHSAYETAFPVFIPGTYLDVSKCELQLYIQMLNLTYIKRLIHVIMSNASSPGYSPEVTDALYKDTV